MRSLFLFSCSLLMTAPAWAVQQVTFLTPTVSGGQASQTANSTRLETDNRIYQAVYNATDWTGDLKEFDVQSSGALQVTASSAGNSLPNTRILISAGDDTDSNGIVDEGIVLTASNMASTGAWSVVSAAASSVMSGWDWDDLINYLDDASTPATGAAARVRSSVIGDIINSAPQFSGNFNFGYESLAQTSVSGASSSPGDLYASYIAFGWSLVDPASNDLCRCE